MNRELDVIYTKFKLGLLENREYKINFFMVLLFDFSVIIVLLLFLLILEQTSSVANWSVLQYFLFIVSTLFAGKFYFGLTFRDFNRILLSGEFNMYVAKPVHPFSFLLAKNLNGANSLSLLIIVFPLISIVLFFFEYTLFAWMILVLGVFQALVYFWLIELTAFVFKNNYFISYPMKRTLYFFEDYVPLFFQNTRFFAALAFIPSVIYSYLVVAVASGNFEHLYFLYISTIMMVLFSVLCVMMWKRGVKKYEAYG